MNSEDALLIVPLMDFISRWRLTKHHSKSAAIRFFNLEAGFEPHEKAAITAFIEALENKENSQ